MGAVDPDDDTIERWIVWHHRFDEERRERRNVVIAAFDDRTEFEERFAAETARLEATKAAGTSAPTEHIGGVIKPAGYAAAASERRAGRGSASAAPE